MLPPDCDAQDNPVSWNPSGTVSAAVHGAFDPVAPRTKVSPALAALAGTVTEKAPPGL